VILPKNGGFVLVVGFLFRAKALRRKGAKNYKIIFYYYNKFAGMNHVREACRRHRSEGHEGREEKKKR
jgi:hypothetical protein